MCNIEIKHRVVSTESRYFLDPHPCEIELRTHYLCFIHLLSVEVVLHIFLLPAPHILLLTNSPNH